MYSQVELYVSCQGLKRSDLTSKSDPFAVLSLGRANAAGLVEMVEQGRTETIDNTHDPAWTKQFLSSHIYSFSYLVTEEQTVHIAVFDDDKVTSDDNLGEVKFTLASLLSSRGQSQASKLRIVAGRAKGTMTVKAEEMAACHDWVKLSFAGIKLPNKDGLFGKSDPFYIISRVREDGSFQEVYKSEVVDNNLNPTWQVAQCSVQQLCNGDLARPLRITIMDHDGDGSHDYMCSMETSLKDILEKAGSTLPLINTKKNKQKGSLKILGAEFFKKHTFLDFIKGGCEINMTVAIDFTGSNGDPRSPQSLHYMDPRGNPNQYMQAIASVGSILEVYDADKMYPVFGFGGRLGNGQVDHCFPIYAAGGSGSGAVHGVQGILGAYQAAITSIQLSGPTLFSEILQTTMASAQQQAFNPDKQAYTVLLILTDGVVNDFQQTVDNLVLCANLPVSVIVVGVGDADFSQMVALDGDGEPLRSSSGQVTERDIVQFVEFRKYGGGSRLSSLASDTLKEVPGQLTAYMKKQGIQPKPARPPLPQPVVVPVQTLPTPTPAAAAAAAPNLQPPAPPPAYAP
ncbi:unnamed protein product [Chrysoparadoxa australica]